jgi:hypothetical protein
MKCSHVRIEIDRMVYEGGPEPGSEIYRHIGSCSSCTRYLEESRLAAGKIAGIRHMEPILENPEDLTENIMKAISGSSKENIFKITGKRGKLPFIIILQRLLAAASVCLFMVFAYEEYILVDKISLLEKQHAAISQIPQYQSTLKMQKAMSILAADPEILSRLSPSSLINSMQRFIPANYENTKLNFNSRHHFIDALRRLP